MKTLEEIKQELDSKFSINTVIEGKSLVVPKEKWFEIANFLKTDPQYQLDYLSSVTGVDYREYLEVVYHLYSMRRYHFRQGQVSSAGTGETRPSPEVVPEPLSIKVRTPAADAKVPSVTPIWRSAEFQEREAYDLIGIHFEGHPDLRRILMWEEFQFHPLRKDYVMEDQDR